MSLKIGKYEIKYPIIQGGMGVGISWDRLAGTVSSLGGLGTISTVGTGFYQNGKSCEIFEGLPKGAINAHSGSALKEIFNNARKICKDAPLACNILYAMTDYSRVVKDAIDAGANIIVTGAGLPTSLAGLVKNFPDVAIVPIVSSAKAFKVLCKYWKREDRLPDAVIVEGPLCGGHIGVKKEDLYKEEYQLENILVDVVEERKNWGDMPVIAAGGIWDRADAQRMMALGADGIQLGTKFVFTEECDADQGFKEVLLDAKEEDIAIVSSPVGYPARAVKNKLIKELVPRKIKCISNCIIPCEHGKGASEVGYCIAASLSKSKIGDKENGLFFCGANAYKAEKIVSVKEVIEEFI